MQLLGHLLGVERLCGFRGLLDDLDAGGAVERIGFRLEFFWAEFLDDFLRLRLVPRIGSVGHQRSFDARPADRGKLIRRNAVASHQRSLYALVTHLPNDQAAFGVEAAPIDEISTGLLDLGHKRRKVLLSGVDAFVEDFLHAALVEGFFCFVGEAFAVRRLVVHEGDLLALEMFDNVFAGDFALLVITSADAENVPHVAFGDFWVGRRGRDLQDTVFLVDLGRGDRDTGIVVADDVLHAASGKFVGNRYSLFGVGDVVAVRHGDFLTEDPAAGIDIRGRLIDAVFHLRASRGAWTGNRSAHAEFDLGRCGSCRRHRNAQYEA